MDKTMTHEEIVKRTLEDQNLINKEIAKKAWIQTEEIVWNKYPETKPEEDGEYLVQFLFDNKRKYFETCDYDYKGNLWFDGEGYMYSDSMGNLNSIVAWAEMPKGYTEET